MRQTFLLDENIIYHAIRGVDRHDQPDTTAAELLKAIRVICHLIFVHPTLIEKYQKALKKMREDPPRHQEANDFLKQFLYNDLKRVLNYGELPPLPDAAREPPAVPREDEEIVQAALISNPIVVTDEPGLEDSVNAHHDILGLTAMDAGEALVFAESERV